MAELSAGKKALADGLVVAVKDFVKRAVDPLTAQLRGLVQRADQHGQSLESLERRASRHAEHLARLESRLKALEHEK